MIYNYCHTSPFLCHFHLGIENLGYVVRIFHEAKLLGKWRAIGNVIKVDVGAINAQCKQNPKSFLLHAIAAWLLSRPTDPRPSWKGVIWVIADQFGGGTFAGARGVANKYRGMQADHKVAVWL